MRYYKEGASGWGVEPERSETPLAIVAMPQDLGSAVPRTVEGANNLFSICDADYSEALRTIADLIGRQLAPACFPECAADLDPVTVGLQPAARTARASRAKARRAAAPSTISGTGSLTPGSSAAGR